MDPRQSQVTRASSRYLAAELAPRELGRRLLKALQTLQASAHGKLPGETEIGTLGAPAVSIPAPAWPEQHQRQQPVGHQGVGQQGVGQEGWARSIHAGAGGAAGAGAGVGKPAGVKQGVGQQVAGHTFCSVLPKVTSSSARISWILSWALASSGNAGDIRATNDGTRLEAAQKNTQHRVTPLWTTESSGEQTSAQRRA